MFHLFHYHLYICLQFVFHIKNVFNVFYVKIQDVKFNFDINKNKKW